MSVGEAGEMALVADLFGLLSEGLVRVANQIHLGGNVMEMLGKCHEKVMKISAKCPRNVMDMSGKCQGNVREMPWKCHENDLDILWKCLYLLVSLTFLAEIIRKS